MTTISAKGRRDKGNRAEREVASQIHDLLGFDVRRTLAGHAEDLGDLTGVPDTVIQVKSFVDIARAMREGLNDLNDQQDRSGDHFAALWVRRPGGKYVVCMTPEQWAFMWSEATRT